MTAPIIPLDPWRVRLRRDMAVHGLRESVRRLMASSDAVLDGRTVAKERVVLRHEDEGGGLPCDTEQVR